MGMRSDVRDPRAGATSPGLDPGMGRPGSATLGAACGGARARPRPPLTDGPAQQGEAPPDFLPWGAGGGVLSHSLVAELAALSAHLSVNCVSLVFLIDL